MSVVSIRAALETALNGMSPSISTSWENASFTPVSGTPYQQVHLLFAEPENTEFGARYREIGYMQVKLMYPLKNGTATASARAELLRTTFARGNTFTSGGINVVIHHTPEIQPGTVEDDRYAINVIIRFYSHINT